MSGTIINRVNQYWDIATQANATQAVMFHRWLLFINDLVTSGRFSIIEVGTAGVSHGTTIPAEWLDWDETTAAGSIAPIAMSGNSWVVFQADKASYNLDASGSDPWQCKVQYTDGTAYADPSGINYGLDTFTHITVIRTSVSGGWSSSPTFDFPVVAPIGSSDFMICSGGNIYFWFDPVADNDTIVWRGNGETSSTPIYAKTRGGYIGILSPRDNVPYPFLTTIGKISSAVAGAGSDAIVGKTGGANYHFDNGNWQWFSYSIGLNNAVVTTHEHNTWEANTISYMSRYAWTTQFVLPRMTVSQNQSLSTLDFNIIGDYRLLRATPQTIGEGALIYNAKTGSDLKEYLQIASYVVTEGGIAMRWPNGVKPLW
jgi:hypothetical protein